MGNRLGEVSPTIANLSGVDIHWTETPLSVLPRAAGTPEPAAAHIIQQILTYAQQPATTYQANVDRIRGLHHILDAASDALSIGFAVANAGPGKVSHRKAEAELGIHKDSVKDRIRKGNTILEELE